MACDYSPIYRAQRMEVRITSVAVRQLFACPIRFVGMVAPAIFVEAALTQPGSRLLARSFASVGMRLEFIFLGKIHLLTIAMQNRLARREG